MNWDGNSSNGPRNSGNGRGGKGPFNQRSFEEFLQDFFEKPGAFLSFVLILALVGGALTSYYIVRAEEKGVVTRFGRYLKTSSEGLHFKLPYNIDRVIFVPTKIQQESFGFGSTRGSSSSSPQRNVFSQNSQSPFSGSPFSGGGRSQSGGSKFQNESLMLTGDLNVAEVEWVVQYKVTNPRDFLFNVADPVKNIRDLSQTTMRRVVGDLSINDILTTGRKAIQEEVQVLMQATIDEKYKMGIEIDEVLLQDVAPPEPVQPSFNQVNSAIQEQKQEINKALEQQNRVIAPAKGKADREISKAKGYSEAVMNRAIGDASRFESVFAEYKKAPQVTRRRLYLELVEDMMGKVQNFTIVDPEVKGLLPIFTGNETSKVLKETKASMDPKVLRGEK